MLIKNLFYFLSLMLLLGGQNAFAQLNLTVTPTAETCPNNGTLDFAVTGQDPSGFISFHIWQKGQVEAAAIITQQTSLTGLSAGFYYIKVIESIGNLSTILRDSSIIVDNQNPLELNLSTVDSKCDSSGVITVNVTNGTAATYALITGPVLRPPQTSNIFQELPEGSYLVNITDAVCTGVSRSKSATVSGVSDTANFISRYWGTPTSGICSSTPPIRTYYTLGNKGPYTIYWIYTLPNATEADTIIGTSNGGLNAFFTTPFPYFGDIYSVTEILVDVCGKVLHTDTYPIRARKLNARLYNYSTEFCGSSNAPAYFSIDVTDYAVNYMIDFIDVPAGFTPNTFNSSYPGPYKGVATFGSVNQPTPNGTYTFAIIDSCGLSDTFTYPVSGSTNSGTLNFGTFQELVCNNPDLMILSASVGNYPYMAVIDSVSPSLENEFVAMYGTLPFDVSSYLYYDSLNNPNNSTFLRLELPTGGYTTQSNTGPAPRYYITYYNSCDTARRNYEAIGYVPNDSFVVTEYCTTFDIYAPPISRIGNLNPSSSGYYLQKYDFVTGNWVHPSRNTIYNPEINNLANSGQLLSAGSLSTNYTYTGSFRVMFQMRTSVTPIQITERAVYALCPTEVFRFSIDSTIDFLTHTYGCTDSLLILDVAATSSHTPLSYSILEKNGNPFVITNGNNPVFTDLEVGIYLLQVTDACSNSSTRLVDVSLTSNPPIVPSNMCDGSDASLSVDSVPGFTYAWFNTNDYNDTLSNAHTLTFNNFSFNSDAGTYVVYITTPSQVCNDIILQYTIEGSSLNPDPGEGLSTTICGTSERGVVNLFDYLSGDYDDYGVWYDISDPESEYLIGNIWDNTSVDPGIYYFLYSIPGSTCYEAVSTLVVFQIDIDCTPLNVDFTNFNVRKMGTSGHLNWKVASEKSTKGYYVEKSLDGQQWSTLNFVPSQAPNGVSSNSLEYQFVDKTLQKGYNFYRIKHMNWEGKHKYSPIKYLEVGTINAIVIHPNPAVDAINIKGLSEGNLLMIHNIVGKKIHESTANAASVQINTQQFQPGIYVLTVIDAQGISSTHKIVIKD